MKTGFGMSLVAGLALAAVIENEAAAQFTIEDKKTNKPCECVPGKGSVIYQNKGITDVGCFGNGDKLNITGVTTGTEVYGAFIHYGHGPFNSLDGCETCDPFKYNKPEYQHLRHAMAVLKFIPNDGSEPKIMALKTAVDKVITFTTAGKAVVEINDKIEGDNRSSGSTITYTTTCATEKMGGPK
jgi:hypothetical protein